MTKKERELEKRRKEEISEKYYRSTKNAVKTAAYKAREMLKNIDLIRYH